MIRSVVAILGLWLATTSVNAERVVIYGASGTLGSKIVTEALNRGHEVVGVGRNAATMTRDHKNFSAMAICPRTRL